MRRLLLALVVISVVGSVPAQTPPPHRDCSWCHTPRPQPKQALLTTRDTRPQLPISSTSVCLSCHDGVTGPDLTDVHAIHVGRFPNEPQTCTACHDPHNRSASYRMLRGKSGPVTAESAMFGFCRGCHQDH